MKISQLWLWAQKAVIEGNKQFVKNIKQIVQLLSPIMPYNKISTVDRNRIVSAHQWGEDYVFFAQQLDINRQTARNIIIRHETEGRVELLQRGGSRGEKMDALMKSYVIEKVEQKPTVTLKELQGSLHVMFPTKPSVSTQTISRFLNGQLITTKLVRTITIQWNAPDVKLDRRNYIHWLTSEAMVDDSSLIYIDECGFNIWTARSIGRAERGQRAVRVVCGSRGKNLTICMAVSPSYGLCHSVFVEVGMTKEKFQDFLSELSAVFAGQKCHFIFDNATPHLNPPPMHHDEHDCNPLPRYSPFLNITENAISALKAAAKQYLAEPAFQALMSNTNAAATVGYSLQAFRLLRLKEIIVNCLPTITQAKCANWHNGVLAYIPSVSRGEDITF
jgi:transposase